MYKNRPLNRPVVCAKRLIKKTHASKRLGHKSLPQSLKRPMNCENCPIIIVKETHNMCERDPNTCIWNGKENNKEG